MRRLLAPAAEAALPVVVLRKDDDAAIVELAQQARGVAELYGAETSKARLVDAARSALENLSLDDAAEVKKGMRRVPEAVRPGRASVE